MLAKVVQKKYYPLFKNKSYMFKPFHLLVAMWDDFDGQLVVANCCRTRVVDGVVDGVAVVVAADVAGGDDDGGWPSMLTLRSLPNDW